MQTKLIIGVVAVFVLATAVYFFSPQADAPTVEEVAADLEPSEEPETAEEAQETSEAAPETETAEAQSSSNTTAPSQTTTATPKPSPAPATAPSLPYTATIYYDGGRFIPDEVTVIEGGTVRFVNGSETIKMWVASNNHPTHTVYPLKTSDDCKGSSFDQCEAVGFGGSWSFTFDRFGTWGFHNHERARDTGKIVVMTREDYLKSF